MRAGTIALIVQTDGTISRLIEALSDSIEIEVLEKALEEGEQEPLLQVYKLRALQTQEDEQFGDYVESLLSQPFVRPEIQEHAVQWFKSKLRIEKYRKSELESVRVIASYAFQIFEGDPNRTDFVLSGPTAKVRVRVFKLSLPHAAVA